MRASLIAVVSLLTAASAAQADVLTLGSPLDQPASITLSQGADTAYWLTNHAGDAVHVPADGQVVQVRIRGAAMSEPGAGPPANMVRFQTLGPAGADGSRRVDLTTPFFDMPIDAPDRVSSFAPENLCVREGGAVAFNTFGGYGWNGGDPFDPHPADPSHYRQGTPWRIFAAVDGSTTAWFSKAGGTGNGDVLTPSGGADAREGYGSVERGTELLLQVVVATGDDRSPACGGSPRSAGGGSATPPVRELRVVGGSHQRPYVTRDRRFRTGVYCQTPGERCRGRALLRIGGRIVARAAVSVPARHSARVPMRLPAGPFRRLDRQGVLRVTYILVTQFGRTTQALRLNR